MKEKQADFYNYIAVYKMITKKKQKTIRFSKYKTTE